MREQKYQTICLMSDYLSVGKSNPLSKKMAQIQ